jgi:hypothetical protein
MADMKDVPKPGTPEWEAQYKAAEAALDAEERGEKATPPTEPATQPAKKTDEPAPAATTPPAEPPKEAPKGDEQKPNPELDQLRKELDSTKKALNDTKAWGTKLSQNLAELKKKDELAELEKSKPKALQDNPEMLDALDFQKKRDEILSKKPEEVVPPPPEPKPEAKAQPPEEDDAYPDLGTLRKDKTFNDALVAAAKAAGKEWDDPFAAARIISDVKLKVEKEKIVAEARQKAKHELMQEFPGGSSKPSPVAPTKSDEELVREIHSMSNEEWDAYLRKNGHAV